MVEMPAATPVLLLGVRYDLLLASGGYKSKSHVKIKAGKYMTAPSASPYYVK